MGDENVTAQVVNYHQYTTEQYDRDIRNAIPFHNRIHELTRGFILENWEPCAKLNILELGVGTGLTTQVLLKTLLHADFTVVDFSEHMIAGARNKLGTDRIEYVIGDYTKINLGKAGTFDIVVSVIGLHHQTDVGKLAMFNKIRKVLKPENGVFIFGDLVTFRDPQKAATAAANHYHHLVEKAEDDKTLAEWAHHHMFLNKLAPLEDQLDWLKVAGFETVELLFEGFQTALIIVR